MAVGYDKYYKTKNLFGNPYPELVQFFADYSPKGQVLDLGCGQGRDTIALARLGFEVTGIDISRVGIEQMKLVAQMENLSLKGVVADIFNFEKFSDFDFVLFNSMFHFLKKDRAKEAGFIKKVISKVKSGTLLIFCIQDISKKVGILYEVINSKTLTGLVKEQSFEYIFKDGKSGHESVTFYKMIVLKKF